LLRVSGSGDAAFRAMFVAGDFDRSLGNHWSLMNVHRTRPTR